MNVNKIIFDQYSRYQACADLLALAGIGSGHSILDIGSGPEMLFRHFIQDADMSFVDPLIPDEETQFSISGDVFNSRLDEASYDCVSAVDVLEHVPSDERVRFLERVSSLANEVLILGFPTSDTTVGSKVDKAVDDQYRAVFGTDYSWLDEHKRYGLPSLEQTVYKLEEMGWHCQSIGHGHAPWLEELLGLIVSVWEVDELKEQVLEISERYIRDLYQYDFQPPCYRQFIVASKKTLPNLSVPEDKKSMQNAEDTFQELMDDAKKKVFNKSIQLLARYKYNQIILERDTALRERGEAIHDRDILEQEIDLIKASKSWLITSPIRYVRRTVQYGFLEKDRQRITLGIRKNYHRLPLPTFVKSTLRFIYHGIFARVFRFSRQLLTRSIQFAAPTFKPSVQKTGLRDYIIWGVVDWHFRHQRPQQLAQELAKTGCRVFYVSSLFKDDHRAGFEIEKLDEDNPLFQVNLFVNRKPSIYKSAPGIEVIEQITASIGEVMIWANCGQLISLVQHPFWYDVASILPNSHLVYDCMDHHEGFGNNGESLMWLEKRLLSSSDLNVTTSAWLEESISSQSKNHVLIRNAGNYEHFCEKPSSVYQDTKQRQIIGYYGAIAEWFDLDLVEEVARRFKEYAVVLVGEDTVNAKARLGNLQNVTFTGEVAYDQLPFYLYGFSVCMLPFKVLPLTLATNPVKAYEYLSAGKSLVTVDLPEMKQFGDLVYVAESKDEFLDAVGNVLTIPESDLIINKRKEFASGQTWTHRANELITATEAIIEPCVSIVVVTYNNLELTKSCLSSIDEQSLYNNTEIIVVDNASSDGSHDYLSKWVDGADNRKLILNDENLGFAAANNQGLEISAGDYLVLLNNDTYVTPGWVATLVGHINRDNTIGLIGPVTNNIGNEAKIDIEYKNMNDMLAESAEFTRRHIGRLYPLKTAAFFCVMMHRNTYEKIGPLDEQFGTGYFEDDDYCRRIEKVGLRVVCAEDVFVHHHLSASFDKLDDEVRNELFNKNKAIYEKKWGKWLPHTYR